MYFNLLERMRCLVSLTKTECTMGLSSRIFPPRLVSVKFRQSCTTKHAEVHPVREDRLAMPQAGVHEIKQNVFATGFNLFFCKLSQFKMIINYYFL